MDRLSLFNQVKTTRSVNPVKESAIEVNGSPSQVPSGTNGTVIASGDAMEILGEESDRNEVMKLTDGVFDFLTRRNFIIIQLL